MNKAATKLQCMIRRRIARKRVAAARKKAAAAKKEIEWMKKFQKEPAAGPVAAEGKELVPRAEKKSASPAEEVKPDLPTTGREELDSKLRRLEELEKVMIEREKQMAEAAKVAEERAAAMEQALKQMEERARQDEADRLLRQQLLEMAAGPISHRSDYAMRTQQHQQQLISARSSHSHYGGGGGGGGHHHSSQPPSARSSGGRFSARSHGNLTSARHHVGYMTPRLHDAPPTARSARDGSAIPADAARMHFEGEDWVQLWDPEERSHYWYCERTQQAQWETPGAPSASMDLVSYQGHGGGDDSGYESGAMTDYSTDHYESGGEDPYWEESGHTPVESAWHEYWDDLAKAKYWYNSQTVCRAISLHNVISTESLTVYFFCRERLLGPSQKSCRYIAEGGKRRALITLRCTILRTGFRISTRTPARNTGITPRPEKRHGRDKSNININLLLFLNNCVCKTMHRIILLFGLDYHICSILCR